jgi:hypothetical protein
MLKIELVEHRAAETWKQHWDALAEAGLLEQPTVVSDQGPGLLKGCTLMGLTHHPELLHLLRPLAMCGERFSRKALAAIAREYERGSREVGRAEAVLTKRSAAYEAAKAEAEEQIRRDDDCCSLWTALRQALALCDEQGEITALTSRQAEMAAIVQLLDALACAPLHQALASFASGLEGSWGYDQRAEQVYQEDSKRDPCAVVQALACGWQWQRQATNSKTYGMRQRLAPDAECSVASAATFLPEACEVSRKEMVAALETEGRSSSLVENVNSALRPLLETCRGQVDQQMLDLCAYVHNHRCVVRGKRAGKAPIEILTGTEMDKTWLPSL